MLRFFSFLLILMGAVALAYGGYQIMQVDGPAPEIQSAEAPAGSIGFDGGNSKPSQARSIAPEKPVLDEMFGVASSSTDDIISSLQTFPVAHETPATAVFGRPFTVVLSLDATGDESATDSLPGTGNIVEGEAQVSETVRAVLSGDAFEITPLTPDTLRVSPLVETVWRWQVTPLETGKQRLTFEMFALMENAALPLRTFNDDVQVEVSRFGQVVAIARSISPITVVAGGIGSLLAGLFGFVRLFRS